MAKGDFDGLTWLNEPPSWTVSDDALTIETADASDFWQDTFYGFRRDSGHLLGRPVAGDFSAEARFEGDYEALYDQAGLMLRAGPETWIKAGIEYTDGQRHFSVVVTNGRSDWSVLSLGPGSAPLEMRVTRHGDAVRVQYRDGEGRWALARLAWFAAPETITVGPMACSPERSGFRVRFTDFRVGPPIDRALHD